MVQITTTSFFLFIKEHLKIILLICLPISFGILYNHYSVSITTSFGSIFGHDFIGILLIPNFGSSMIMAILNMPFFYDVTMYKHEWIIHPILNVISNLIFWIPTALLINRAYKKRKLKNT